MGTQATLGSLSLFTMIAVLAVLIGAALWFFRTRSNRVGLGDKGMSDTLHRATETQDTTARARDSR